MVNWQIDDSYGASAMEQAAFLVIANRAIDLKGWDNRGGVSEYVFDQLQKEFPASGRKWVVLYDTNANFSIFTSYDKMFFAEEGGSRTEYLYAARV